MQPVAVGADDGLVDGGQLGGLDGERQLDGDELAAFELGIQLEGRDRVQCCCWRLPWARAASAWLSSRSASLALPWAMPREDRDLDPVLLPPGRGSSAPVADCGSTRPREMGARAAAGAKSSAATRQSRDWGGASRCRRRATWLSRTVGDADAEAIVDLAKVLQVDQQQAGCGRRDGGWSAGSGSSRPVRAVVVLLLLQLEPGWCAAR